ncbi:cysteine hydrolase family protein [Pseudoneobacillus rhizosphaerae]|uniref:Enterobactin synthase component B n=1 Tax=Pseudoneobacillus rhizosphaerae TaxID=2880968 RepID=A0A9C7GDT3_9BACI|nr:isochorismatase family cysteine hydrolase [Pseudoneobacillus rhizosphaerae]CAG9610746.1 Enterobactin synthase component B [Pseudoneobacillus rhizosphaerae]
MTTFPPNSALLIIDVINNFEFEHGKILAKKTLHIVNPLKQLKKYFKKQQLPIIYVNDHYNLWQANLDRIVKSCLNPLSEMILQEIKPDEDDYFLIKPMHSAFYETALNTLLQQLHVNTLVLTGIAGNICVLFTANDAYMRDYQLIIPRDCMASVDDRDQSYALTMMKNVLKAEIIFSNDYIEN